MTRFLTRRILGSLVVLWLVFTITFTLMYHAPGGPFASERKATPEVEHNLKVRYGVDGTFGQRYRKMLGDSLRGDLGPCFSYADFTVNEIVASGFPVTASLGLVALGLALALGISAGTFAAANRNSILDVGVMLLATMGIAVPSFIFATVSILLFAFKLPLFPAAGWGTLQQAILPPVCLSLPYAAYIARLTRTSMLDVLSQDCIRTARAKGLAPRVVLLKHALRSAILPVVSFIGPATANILAGSLVVERVFNLPGIGTHLVDAAQKRDYMLSMGLVLLYAVLLCALNLVADLLYSILDPRVKLEA